MKRSAMKLVAIAVLVRTALATTPVLADDLLEHASAEPACAIAGTETTAVHRDQPSRELLMRVAGWLSVEFGLSIDAPPHVEFATRERLSRLRIRGVPSDHLGNGREVVAIYDDDGRAIYLPRGWSGNTAAEMSILVHEMGPPCTKSCTPEDVVMSTPE